MISEKTILGVKAKIQKLGKGKDEEKLLLENFDMYVKAIEEYDECDIVFLDFFETFYNSISVEKNFMNLFSKK